MPSRHKPALIVLFIGYLENRMLKRNAMHLRAVVFLVALLTAALGAPAIQAQPVQATEATPRAQATKYPPCPPSENSDDVAATEEPTAEATAKATPTVTPTATPTITPTFDARAEFAPAYLGIAAEDVADCGSRVIEIISGSPADRAGFRLGDVIVAADGVPRRNVAALRSYVTSRTPGQSVLFVIKRNDQELEIRAVLGLRPRAMPPTVTPVPTKPEATKSN
jgi:membrane-associated protease RseP (regulator of RpoE activity)